MLTCMTQTKSVFRHLHLSKNQIMKKNFLGLGLILSGLLFIWSCSSDDKTVVPQDETFDLQLGFDLQDLGNTTKGDPIPAFLCLSEAELAALMTNNDPNDDVEALVTLSKNGANIMQNQKVQLRAIKDNGRDKLVTEALVVPYEANANYKIEEMKIVKKSDNSIIHYATVLPGSPVYIANTQIGSCVTSNTTPMTPKKFDKIYHELCLHCMQNYTPTDFGLSILTPNYHKHYCINFIVDLCGQAGGGSDINKDMLGTGTYEIFRAVLSSNEAQPSLNTVWTKIAEGQYGKHGSADPVLGRICFYDDPKVDNAKEWYSIRLLNTAAPLINYYIETVPVCPPDGTPLGKYVRGVPLTKMLTLLKESGHKPGGIINNGVVHFWWCDVIANKCAPNLYSWPTNPGGGDTFTWYDTVAQ